MSKQKTQRQGKRFSLLRRTTCLVITIYSAAFGLMFLSDATAVHSSLQIVYESLDSSLQLTASQLEKSLENAETNVVSRILSQNLNIQALDQERSSWDSAFFSRLYQVRTEMQNSLPSLELVQGLFVFPPSNQLFISATIEGDGESADRMQAYTRELLASGTLQETPQHQWFLANTGQTWFLVRYFQLNGIYLGAWIDLEDLLSFTDGDGAFLLYASQGIFVNSGSQQAQLDLTLPEQEQQEYVLFTGPQGEDYVVVCASLPNTEEGRLVLLSPKSPLVGRLYASYLWMILCGCVFVIAFLPVLFWILHYLRKPISQLHQSIITLRRGDFDVPPLPTAHGCREFNEVNGAFNDMVTHIRSLKIDLYERQLLQQKTEMKFLRSQLAPHFMINCLNAIYHMSAAGEDKMVQKMAVSLSSHLRYVLSDYALVPLEQELSMVENYLNLFSIRFPQGLVWEISAQEESQGAAVLPMIVLPFIENSVKYEMVPGQCLRVFVQAGLSPRKDELAISLWDSGSGWTQELLEILNSGSLLTDESGKHIGIRNIVQRCRLTYGEDFQIHFSNHPGAGAQIDIRLPYKPYTQAQPGKEVAAL